MDAEPVRGRWLAFQDAAGVLPSRILHTDFYEKALFVKPTWRLYLVAERICFRPIARYASIRCEYAIGGCGRRPGLA
jgi:hypothetical protein